MSDDKAIEKCMFCETMIVVPEPNKYVVICAPCRQKAYETSDRISASTEQDAAEAHDKVGE